MKYVVVIALVSLVLFLLYRKLRPYLIAGKNLLTTIRDLQSKLTRDANSQSRPEKLMRCDACGTWVPSARMQAKSGKMFCSQKCLTIRRIK